PALVDQIQALEEPVVGDLALQLRQRPRTLQCTLLEPVGERASEVSGGVIEARRHATSGGGGVGASAAPGTAASWETVSRASVIQSSVAGSPTRSSSQRSNARPSPRRSPK